MAQDHLTIAGDHHRLMIEHLARARSHETIIKHLLVGRMVTTDVYVNPMRVSDVQVKGLEIHIYGRANPKRRRSILLATHLSSITIVKASDMDASSREEALNEAETQ